MLGMVVLLLQRPVLLRGFAALPRRLGETRCQIAAALCRAGYWLFLAGLQAEGTHEGRVAGARLSIFCVSMQLRSFAELVTNSQGKHAAMDNSRARRFQNARSWMVTVLPSHSCSKRCHLCGNVALTEVQQPRVKGMRV